MSKKEYLTNEVMALKEFLLPSDPVKTIKDLEVTLYNLKSRRDQAEDMRADRRDTRLFHEIVEETWSYDGHGINLAGEGDRLLTSNMRRYVNNDMAKRATATEVRCQMVASTPAAFKLLRDIKASIHKGENLDEKIKQIDALLAKVAG